MLKQMSTGMVKEYVKSFTSLILDIKDKFEVDKLFNLISMLHG